MFFNNDSTVIHRSMWGSAPDIGLQILDQVDALRSRSCGLGSAMSQLHNLHRVNSDRHSDLKDHGDRLLRTVVNANENFDVAIDYWKSRIAAIRAKIAAVKHYYQQKRLQIDRAQTTLLETLPFQRPRLIMPRPSHWPSRIEPQPSQRPLYIPSSTHSKTPLDLNPIRPRLIPHSIPTHQRCRQTVGTSQPDPNGGKKASARDRFGCPDSHPESPNQKMPLDIFASPSPIMPRDIFASPSPIIPRDIFASHKPP